MIDVNVLQRLGETLAARKGADPASSYVAGLMAKGEDAILRKVAEESAESLWQRARTAAWSDTATQVLEACIETQDDNVVACFVLAFFSTPSPCS